MTTPRLIQTGKLKLNFVADGPAQGETLVFIHAVGFDLTLWETVAAPLTSKYRVLRYDLRGHGLSDSGPPECTVQDHARDLAGALDTLDIAKVTLVGISVGGLVAQAFAVLFPGRVNRLMLCATGARIGTPEAWTERISLIKTKGMEAMADGIIARWFAPDFPAREPALVRRLRDRLVRIPLPGYLATCAALRDADLRSSVGGIAVPALVISGECDVAAPPAAGRELAGLLPKARFEMIRGVGHFPPLENPEAVLALINGFLASP